MRTPNSQPRSTKFWNWFEALSVGLLALIGFDILVNLLLGVGVGIYSQLVPSVEFGGAQLESVSWQFGLFTISRLLGFGLIVWFIARRGVSLKKFGFRPFKPLKSLGLIVASAVFLLFLSGLIFYLAEQVAPTLNLEQEQDIIFTEASGAIELTLAFVALVIIAPVVEESIFRGLMLPAFARRFGIAGGVILTSLIFGSIHGQLNVAIITFVMGLLLSGLYYATRSLVPAIMFHSLKNLVAFGLIFNFI